MNFSRRTVPVLLAIATLIPIGALGWLALRLLRQDREMEGQHRRENLEYAAGRVVLAIDGRLAAIEDKLARGQGIRLTPAGLEAASVILYQPAPFVSADPPPALFAAGEAAEFQRHDLRAAATEYRHLAESPLRTVRAAALVRLGRTLRASRDRGGALEAYRRLLDLGVLRIAGQPVELIARQGLCRVYQEAADVPALRRETAELQRTLFSGAVPIDRATFSVYRDLLAEWGGAVPPADAVARTEAAIVLWSLWRRGDLPAGGRRIVRVASRPALIVWAGGPEHPAAWIATPADLASQFSSAWTAQHLTAAGYDPEGQPLFGSPTPAAGLTLSPGETRLPFLLRIAFDPGRQPDGPWAARRNILIGGLIFTTALMLAAAYGLFRATAREMALARQQSDFVSAVSHEFRTPITSMRHLTELLASNSVPTDDRKAQYYAVLARETERLHRLVESLLSFGRMQAGSYAWRLERADPADLLRAVVDEFRHEPQSAGREVLCDFAGDLPLIRVDREAISRAVSNLLDNADKYSAPGAPIRVAARRDNDAVRISVEDNGAGIPLAEQATLFGRFVRGSQARAAGIRGIGVGLALVKSVAEAHGGAVQLTSEPGRGSTFTLVIPCPES